MTSARLSRDEHPALFEIFKNYAESRGAAIHGDVVVIKGEWSEFEVNGVSHQRVYNLGFQYRAQPDDVAVDVSITKNLTIIRSEGTT